MFGEGPHTHRAHHSRAGCGALIDTAVKRRIKKAALPRLLEKRNADLRSTDANPRNEHGSTRARGAAPARSHTIEPADDKFGYESAVRASY